MFTSHQRGHNQEEEAECWYHSQGTGQSDWVVACEGRLKQTSMGSAGESGNEPLSGTLAIRTLFMILSVDVDVPDIVIGAAYIPRGVNPR